MQATIRNRSRDGVTALTMTLFLGIVLVAGSPREVMAADLQYRAGTPSDRDGDGVGNALDADDDNDLIADVDELPGDADGDGVLNAFDVDADNDGIADLLEAITDRALLALLDADEDGQLDASVDIGANGMAVLAETAPGSGQLVTGRVDTDGDGLPDYLDIDSDDDGLVDVIEAGGIDLDRDGRVDRFRDLDGDGRDDQLAVFPISPRDTDDDGIYDFRDLDSDNDGASDRFESSGIDTDGDGVVDGLRDENGDGLDDGAASMPITPMDSGGDSRPDHLDRDTTPTGFLPLPAGAGAEGSIEAPSGVPTFGRPVTGRAGNPVGGCSSASSVGVVSGPRDPSLSLLLLIALVVAVRRAPWVRGRTATAALAAVAVAGCSALPRSEQGGAPTRQSDTGGLFDMLHAGIGVGATRLDPDTGGTGLEIDERASTSVQLMLGTSITPWLDAEVRASDLGDLALVGGDSIGYQAIDVAAVARRSVGRAELFARVGGGALFNEGGVDVERRNPSHLLLGAGVDLNIARGWQFRLEANGHDVDAVQAGVGLVYRFGRLTRGLPPLASRGELSANDSAASETGTSESVSSGSVASGSVSSEPLSRELSAVESPSSEFASIEPASPETASSGQPAVIEAATSGQSDLGADADSAGASAQMNPPRPDRGRRPDIAARPRSDLPPETTSPPETAARPDIAPRIAVTSLPEITPRPDVATRPESTPLPEIAPQADSVPLPDIALRPEIEPQPDITPLTEIASQPDITPLPEIASQPEITPRPEITSRPEITPRPESTPLPDIAPRPDISPRPEVAAVPSIESVPDAVPAPDVVADAVLAPDAVDPAATDPMALTAFSAADYDIRFAPDSERMTDASQGVIEALAEALSASPDVDLAIVTRSTAGGGERAEFLSRRRALAVLRALGAAGVDVARLRPEVRSADAFGADAGDVVDQDTVRVLER